MANALFNTYKQDVQKKLFDQINDVIKASLVDAADYTFNAAHDEYSGASRDVPLVAIVAESGGLTTKAVSSSGAFDTDDFTWTAVSGDQSEDILVWDDTLTNDRLMAFYDTGMTGMPVTPNGGDISVVVNASGWWTL